MAYKDPDKQRAYQREWVRRKHHPLLLCQICEVGGPKIACEDAAEFSAHMQQKHGVTIDAQDIEAFIARKVQP